MTKPDQTSPPVIWAPTRQQEIFLKSSEFEVLYGGAVGGGKSDALLIDALGLNHGGMRTPNHRAILFRKTYPELRDLIARSLDLYPQISPGAQFLKTEAIWRFPSGATVEFAALHDETDRYKYRGRQWNYIGFDELTLWPTDSCYLYLFSRCRTADPGLRCLVRATTNPDGPGQKWVMDRFAIAKDGGASRVAADLVDPEHGTRSRIYRRFIPARLSDNPHLDSAEYRQALLQLPKHESDALLLGRWESRSAEGAYYMPEMQKLRAADRIRLVPYDPTVPVNTFWDIGMNDCTAIWFHQLVQGEHRFIRAYENSGESLEFYARYLLNTGYNLGGCHYLPHDADHRSLQTGCTHADVLRDLLPGLRFEVVPRVPDLLVGINHTRAALCGNVFFDSEHCAAGIVALDNYQKAYDPHHQIFRDRPKPSRYNHLADALRQWGQVVQEGSLGRKYQQRPKRKYHGILL